MSSGNVQTEPIEPEQDEIETQDNIKKNSVESASTELGVPENTAEVPTENDNFILEESITEDISEVPVEYDNFTLEESITEDRLQVPVENDDFILEEVVTLQSELVQPEDIVVGDAEKQEQKDTEILETTLQPDEVRPEETIKTDHEIHDQEHIENKDDEAPSEKNIIEKQDAEEVKEKTEQLEKQLEHETSLEELESLITNEEELDVFQLDDEEKKQEKTEQASAINTSAKKKKKRSKKRHAQTSQSTIGSIHLETPRPTIIGDFTALGKFTPALDIVSYTIPEDSDEEDYEEEEVEIAQVIFTEYTREECYEMYNNLDKQYQEEKLKNEYLVRKLANYYTKRKVFHALHEAKLHLESVRKYEKQLDDFKSLTNEIMTKHMNLEAEIHDLEAKLSEKEQDAQMSFENFQRHQHELGKQIIGSESINGREEKGIDHCLKRQKVQLNTLKKIRLNYIKIRNKVIETQAALDAIDNLGPNLRLIDYEELKFQNKNLFEKLEEKDLELAKIRRKYDKAVQILAHRREKTSALQEDIRHMSNTLDNRTGEHEDVREQLNSLKHQRDFYRNCIEKVKERVGLLSNPKLMRNMCETLDENIFLGDQLDDVKNEYNILTESVEKIRKNRSSKLRMKVIEDKMKLKEVESNHTDSRMFSSSNSDVMNQLDD